MPFSFPVFSAPSITATALKMMSFSSDDLMHLRLKGDVSEQSRLCPS